VKTHGKFIVFNSFFTESSVPDAPDISLSRRVIHSMTVHMDYLGIQECHGFDVSWIPHDGTWIQPDSNVYITGLDEANIYFLGWAKKPRESNSATPVTTVQNIPILPIFRSTTCLYLHDCAHGDSLPTRILSISMFPGTARRCHG
jgi:hypothetical protein